MSKIKTKIFDGVAAREIEGDMNSWLEKHSEAQVNFICQSSNGKGEIVLTVLYTERESLSAYRERIGKKTGGRSKSSRALLS